MRTVKMLLLSLLSMCVLMSYAFADVAVGPMYAVMFGVPVLAIAIIVIVAALIVHTLRKARAQQQERDMGMKHGAEHAKKDSNGQTCDWKNKDPWDVKRD